MGEKILYGAVVKELINVSKASKEFAHRLHSVIPESTYKKEKDTLIAITLICDVSSHEELKSLLETKIGYLTNLYGSSPDDSVVFDAETHEKNIDKYKAMMEVLQLVFSPE